MKVLCEDQFSTCTLYTMHLWNIIGTTFLTLSLGLQVSCNVVTRVARNAPNIKLLSSIAHLLNQVDSQETCTALVAEDLDENLNGNT